MDNLQIRDAQLSDQQALQAVTLAAYQEYALTMGEVWQGYRQNILETLADVKPAQQLVAEQNRTILGTVLLFPAGTVFNAPGGERVTLPAPEIRLLAIMPQARGQGIGEALVRECIRRARESGASQITLHTTDLMQAAMRLYERMGFQRATELDFIPAENVIVKGYRLALNR